MADAVTATKVEDGPKKATFYLTNTSDGTGEAAVTKIDVSALAALQDGTVCTGVRIENITFTKKPFTLTSNHPYCLYRGPH